MRCSTCHTLHVQTAPPAGASTDEILDRYERMRKRIYREIPSGRGHTLDGIIFRDEAKRGTKSGIAQPGRQVRITRQWLDHLATDRWSDLEEHLGEEPTPRVAAAYRAVSERRDAWRQARDRVDSMEGMDDAARDMAPRILEERREQLTSKAAAYDALAATHHCTPDAVRKAVEREERSVPDPDHRRVVLAAHGREGAPDIYIDIEELERRYPGTWERLTGHYT